MNYEQIYMQQLTLLIGRIQIWCSPKLTRSGTETKLGPYTKHNSSDFYNHCCGFGCWSDEVFKQNSWYWTEEKRCRVPVPKTLDGEPLSLAKGQGEKQVSLLDQVPKHLNLIAWKTESESRSLWKAGPNFSDPHEIFLTSVSDPDSTGSADPDPGGPKISRLTSSLES